MFYLFRGDLKAIRRITLEFCEDVAKAGTLYVEARFCPHLMLCDTCPEVKVEHIIQTVLDAAKTGEELFGTKV